MFPSESSIRYCIMFKFFTHLNIKNVLENQMIKGHCKKLISEYNLIDFMFHTFNNRNR